MVGTVVAEGGGAGHANPAGFCGREVIGPLVADLIPEVGDPARGRADEDEFGHDAQPEEGAFGREMLGRGLGQVLAGREQSVNCGEVGGRDQQVEVVVSAREIQAGQLFRPAAESQVLTP